MNEQQRAVAAVQGYVTEQVIVERTLSIAGEAHQQTLYAVRVSIKGDDPGVTIEPRPSIVQERERVLLETRRLLERREERAERATDHQMLTQALITLTHEIDALL